MTFFRRHMRARGCRVVILGAILSGTLIVSALAQTAEPRPTLYHRLGGTMALPPTLHSCFSRGATSGAFPHVRRTREGQPAAEVPTGRRADLSEDWRSLREVLASPDDAVHDGLGITEANWSTFMKIISDGMSEKRYPADVQAEFLATGAPFVTAWCRNDSATTYAVHTPESAPEPAAEAFGH